ncbi:2-oxoacid:acceptor oxidoreductase subunit alpha [Porticoccus sp. W117]|uniref:2-oxoacid:acceptor oxidoreductase subunit alpha n=1 Tax=Porticoccus sp. W117 TaxID=3054777 RepID=UPI0025982201|nr:2-oxoacid:acceptor oxidoreductase subunit alpha [Porticoccus sp. W117]MDM3870235.1 2-oxoacid:acceptor oxidoreductase subunit alpha [Porticoccus sp. W117]
MSKHQITSTNDFVIRFANVNGTGSASANGLFAKALFRMGLPISPKNIFPSNIQGLPTWYEVRVSEKGYLGRRGGVDISVAMNPQSLKQDIDCLQAGGYLMYDSTKPLDIRVQRDDVHYLGIPLTEMCQREYDDPRKRQLFKNVIYVGALAALLDMDFSVLTGLVADTFKGKEKLVLPNIHALEMGYQYAQEHFQCPLGIRVERRDLTTEKIMMSGNDALGLGAVYGGATVVGWYPITPSTSAVEAFEKYANKFRICEQTGCKKFALIQAEDELAAIGIVLGASWNGARSFTATSGPGVSLMSEFLGLAYFAEVPTVLFDIQRTGPSTGMPTRTQQSDILAAAYASHGDTKHVLLFPATPKECFEMSALSFDLADRLQTPIILLSDLDLGMNDVMSDPLEWDDSRQYDRGKVLSRKDLERMDTPFGRYRDVDDDGICYRTYPGSHPQKGAYFTRGSSHNRDAAYTEKSEDYVDSMERLLKKWHTAKSLVPAPQRYDNPDANKSTDLGMLFFGTTTDAALEAQNILAEEGIHINALRVRAFPFNDQVEAFLSEHQQIFVIEQNRDGQLRTLLMNECSADPSRLIPLTLYDGMPVCAQDIRREIRKTLKVNNVMPLRAQTRGDS